MGELGNNPSLHQMRTLNLKVKKKKNKTKQNNGTKVESLEKQTYFSIKNTLFNLGWGVGFGKR